MRKVLLGACAALLLSGTAHAQQRFTFTAHLDPAPGVGVVTGSFKGTLNGNLITNLSNISVAIDGVAFNNNGALYNFAFDQGSGAWVPNTSVASLDGTQNNFVFTDSDIAGGQQYNAFFYSVGNVLDVAAMLSPAAGFYAPGASSFRAQLVPEPASWAMMIGGFVMTGAALRRRRKTLVRFA